MSLLKSVILTLLSQCNTSNKWQTLSLNWVDISCKLYILYFLKLSYFLQKMCILNEKLPSKVNENIISRLISIAVHFCEKNISLRSPQYVILSHFFGLHRSPGELHTSWMTPRRGTLLFHGQQHALKVTSQPYI